MVNTTEKPQVSDTQDGPMCEKTGIGGQSLSTRRDMKWLGMLAAARWQFVLGSLLEACLRHWLGDMSKDESEDMKKRCSNSPCGIVLLYYIRSSS